MRDHHRDAGLVEIPGAGHLSNLEAPEAFDQALLAFLATFDRA
jgi:pimeloyl-ACP methyl ester carboxylesterase